MIYKASPNDIFYKKRIQLNMNKEIRNEAKNSPSKLIIFTLLIITLISYSVIGLTAFILSKNIPNLIYLLPLILIIVLFISTYLITLLNRKNIELPTPPTTPEPISLPQEESIELPTPPVTPSPIISLDTTDQVPATPAAITLPPKTPNTEIPTLEIPSIESSGFNLDEEINKINSEIEIKQDSNNN